MCLLWCLGVTGEVFVCVWDYDRKSHRNGECITYLGSLRDFCVWRWPGRLSRLQSAWRMKSGLKRQEIEMAWEEVGKRRSFGSLSERLIILAAENTSEHRQYGLLKRCEMQR
jgi:hypothetical protein